MTKHSDSSGANKDLQKLIEQKEASIQAKGRLIDNMAYQIRTLSNAVIGFSDLLLSERLSSELTEYVQEIHHAGNGLSALVNEVLDWARLESGRLRVNHTPCELAPIIHKLEKIVAASATEKELNYEIQVDPDLPARIVTDEDRLLKCLINLAGNAFKYTDEGYIRIRILPENRDDKPYIRFDVIDSGKGMTDDQIEHIFEPTLRTEDVNSEVLTMLDMGITVTTGLPLTKQLIELLGGSLTVNSQPNTGSTFTMSLPIGSDSETAGKLGSWSDSTTQPEPDSEEDDKRPRVLLVEDQQSNRMVISLMLEALGMQVETAEDGRDGVEKAAAGQYDLILMDLKMPRMDGYEASCRIRESQTQIPPIVALSAKVLSEEENQQIKNMFDGFLTKPVDSQRLLETIHHFIPDSRPGDAESQPALVQKTDSENEEIITFEYGN